MKIKRNLEISHEFEIDITHADIINDLELSVPDNFETAKRLIFLCCKILKSIPDIPIGLLSNGQKKSIKDQLKAQSKRYKGEDRS